MKKHVLLSAALCMTAVMATACGSKHTQTQETAAETQTGDTTAESESGKILVVYYSASGTTKHVATAIADAADWVASLNLNE